jgi:hypothetical protein
VHLNFQTCLPLRTTNLSRQRGVARLSVSHSTTDKDSTVDLLTYCPHADAGMIRVIWAIPMFCKENGDT